MAQFGYYAFKVYVRLMNESLMVGRRYTLGREHLPARGEKYFIASNHQNCANDPVNIMLALPFQDHVCGIARADLFDVKGLGDFFRWIDLVPAFRLGWEGGQAIERNFESFDIATEKVNEGKPFVVFPEAGHTQGHYLDPFTTGAVRMAFYVAKKNQWKDDIKIVPAAHHYEDYFKLRSGFMVTFSEPVLLKPYYDRFQEHPNSVMREVTRLLHERIQSMMLDEGKEDYEEKDFLRQSAINPAAVSNLPLPQRMEKDRTFIDSIRSNEDYQEIIEETKLLREKEDMLGTDDIVVEENKSKGNVVLQMLLMVILLPLWVATLLPHVICYALPVRFLKEDRMFTNTYRFLMPLLVLYPLLFVLSLVIGGAICGWWWQTIVWILLWIPGARICWWYYHRLKRVLTRARWAFASRMERKNITDLRNKIRNLIFRK